MNKATCKSYTYEINLYHEEALVLHKLPDFQTAVQRAMSVVCSIWSNGNAVKSVLIHENINGYFSRTVAYIQPKCDNVEYLNI